MKFNTSLRVHVKRISKLYEEGMDYQDVGIVSKFVIDKSKCGPPPFRGVEYVIRSYTGIDNDTSMCNYLQNVPVLDAAGQPIKSRGELLPVVEKGGWYKLHGFKDGTPLNFRYNELRPWLDQNPGVRQYMADQCLRTCPRPIARPILEPDIVAQEEQNAT